MIWTRMWPRLAVIAAACVGALALYMLGWHNSESANGKTQIEQAEAIDAVRLRAKEACDASWWEDDYCVARVKATRFTAGGGEGIWLVREHVRGDKPLQDTCWLVEPEMLARPVAGLANDALMPAPCDMPCPDQGFPAVFPSGRDDPMARILSALCPEWNRSSARKIQDRRPSGDVERESGSLTIVTDIDFSTAPFEGTFEVIEGADELGCAAGTFVDTNVVWAVEKVSTCTQGDRSGSFVILFQPGQEGDVTPWKFVRGTGDYAGVEGEGDFSVDYREEEESGTETLAGDVRFE